jgi:hypothetical protein
VSARACCALITYSFYPGDYVLFETAPPPRDSELGFLHDSELGFLQQFEVICFCAPKSKGGKLQK